MQKIIVSGGIALEGGVAVSGAKNAVLPILCATLLADEPVSIANVPDLHDVKTTLRLLAELGAGVIVEAGADLQIDPRTVRSPVAPSELVKTMRASVLVLGPRLRSAEHPSDIQSLMRTSSAVLCLTNKKNK